LNGDATIDLLMDPRTTLRWTSGHPVAAGNFQIGARGGRGRQLLYWRLCGGRSMNGDDLFDMLTTRLDGSAISEVDTHPLPLDKWVEQLS